MKYSVVEHTVVKNTSEHLQVEIFHWNHRNAVALVRWLWRSRLMHKALYIYTQ